MKNNVQLLTDDTTRHSVFNLNYKIVFKPLHANIVNQRASYLFKQSAKRLGAMYDVHITDWSSYSDRIEMRIHCPSILSVKQFAEKFKQISSSDYHHILSPKSHKSIWCPGFCLITVSSRSKETIQAYLAK